MSKEIFDQDLGEMLEFDSGLDINSVLETLPAIDKETDTTRKTEEETKKDVDPSLDNINKVLDKQIADTKKSEEDEDKKVEADKKDEKAPASLEQPTNDTSDAPFTVIFARDLVTQGLLSSLDEAKLVDEIKSVGEAEALRNLIRSEIDANVDAAKSDLDLGYQEYLRMIGKGVQVETAGSLVELKTRFDGIKSDDLIKEENTELRKQVMTDYFKLTTSMSDAKISKLVQTSMDLGDDIDDSKEYLITLKNLVKEQMTAEEEQASKNVKLQEEENRRSLETLKDSINSLDEIIPGVNINKATKVQMYESITKPIQDNKGRMTNAIWAKRTEDPMFFDERLAYLLSTGFFEKGKSWTKAAQSKITKEVSELERVLKDKSNTASLSGTSVLRTAEQDKTSRDNIDAMRGIFGK